MPPTSIRAKSAGAPRTRRAPRSSVSARATAKPKTPEAADGGRDDSKDDETEDHEAEAKALEQLEAIERLVPMDHRPAGCKEPQNSNFTVEDEAFIHHLLGNLEAMLVTEVMGGSPIIVYASASWVDLMGYDTAEDVLTLPAISVLGGFREGEGLEKLHAALNSTNPSALDVVCVRHAGSKFQDHVIVIPLFDSEGQPIYHLSFHHNSDTDHVASDSSHHLRLPLTPERISSCMSAVLMTSNESLDAPICDVFKTEGATMGYRPGQLKGKSILALSGPDTDSMAKEAILISHMDRKALLQKVLLYQADGQPFWALCLVLPLAQSNTPLRGQSLIRKRDVHTTKQTVMREVKPKPKSYVINRHLCLVMDVTRKQLKKIGRWTMGKVIGKGAQGVVRLGKTSTGEVLAIKMVDASNFRNIRDIDRVQEEIDVLCKLKHKNIIRLVDTYFHNNAFYFAMEWASGGSLVQYMKGLGGRLTEDQARAVFTQIVEALDFCHRRRVVHRDLKPENVLMDENHVVKIADFGLAAITAPFNEGLTLMCGTPEFTAPEIVAGKEYDGASVDIWSLGVMLFEFVSGYLPFQAKEQKELFRMISKGQRAQLPGDVSLDVEDLINSMMQIKVEKRASLEFIQNHPWTTRGGGKTSFDLSTTSCPPSGTSTHQSLRLVLPSDDPMFTGALESNGGASKPEDSEESDVTNAKLLNTPQAESSGVHGNLSRTASEPGRKPLSEGVPGTRRWMSTHPPAPAVTPKTPHGISFRSKGTTARAAARNAGS